MTNHPPPDDHLSEERPTAPRLAWEVPEIFGVAVLVGVGVVMIGGLATGIARAITESTSSFPPGLGNQDLWNAIQFGSQWAGPLIAVIVLGVLGLCWWQVQAWSEAIETPTADGDQSEARDHIFRAQQIARVAMVVLLVASIGSLAEFVAAVGLNAGDSLWVLDLYDGASFLAVGVMLGAGVLVVRQLSHPAVNDPDAMASLS